MGVYIAPEIKDRVAVGDDLYTITDSGGKKKLTPSPTEVAEPGTEINKALLQPMADALQEASENLVPYNDYWWRIRQNAGSYNLRLTPAASVSGAVDSYTHNNGTKYYQLNFFSQSRSSDGEYNTVSRTYKVASNVTVNSNGTISLVNPTTYTSTTDDDNIMNVLTSRCSGKYVQGLAPDTSGIYKISSGASVESTNFSWTVSGETSYQTDIGYKWTGVNSSYVELVVADYSATESDFSYVSNEDENFYPHSGTQDGIEYQFLGKIFDVAVKAEPYQMVTINITSASWNNKQYGISIPHKRYLLFTQGATVLVDNGLAYGINQYYVSGTYDTTMVLAMVRGVDELTCGTKASDGAYVSTLDMDITTTGLTLTTTESTGPALTLCYLPL